LPPELVTALIININVYCRIYCKVFNELLGEPEPIANLGKQKLEPPTKKWFAKRVRRSLFCGQTHNYESFALKINRMENLISTVALGVVKRQLLGT